MRVAFHSVGLAAVLVLAACTSAPPAVESSIPAHAVIGVEATHLDPDFWIRRQSRADQLVLDASAIAAQNARLQQLDPSVFDLEKLPATLTASQVREWIAKISERTEHALFDAAGQEISAVTLQELTESIDLASVPATQPTRYGLVVHRADLRAFPTTLRVFNRRGNADIDRFQESALFPGTPVAMVHESGDRQWWFVVSPQYAAWIEKRHVAEGTAQQVFDYTRKTPYLVVTGTTARTVFTREQPQVSELQLDMGVRVPLLVDWPASSTVSGQHPYAAHVIELPLRASDGALQFTPALLPKTVDVSTDYLPLSRANLLRQSFKFLGERYGWGHANNARDCSGFVSEVYRSFGVQLPRNTSDQGVSPALNRVAFSEAPPEIQRATLRELEVGDLVFVPGHVMMVIGYDRGIPYVIHDTTGISYRTASGSVTRVALNGVSVTPLTPLTLDGEPLATRINNILRIRP
jgi:cell wall-associated NlpC family hydrolase